MGGMRVGIIGYGAIGQTHAEAIAAVGGQVVAIAGRAATTANSALAYHADHRELVARDDVDVIAVCTPSGLHATHALAPIVAGKHIVVEKPIALSLEEGEHVVRAAQEHGALLSVISQRRFEPQQQYLHERIATGELVRAKRCERSRNPARMVNGACPCSIAPALPHRSS